MVTDILCEIADELDGVKDVSSAAQHICQRIATQHKNIIFNGDNYSQDWVKEAEKRGLPNICNAVDGLKGMIGPEVVELFTKYKVLTTQEVFARYEIIQERYIKEINIEALTMLDMAKRQILPAAMEYSGVVASSAANIKAAGANADAHMRTLNEVCTLISSLKDNIAALDTAVENSAKISNLEKQAEAYRDLIVPAMGEVRTVADKLETMVDSKIWPLPTYAEMLFLK
jgi:glutamine synthetase